jgi:ABC-2 type transport system permease protein/sodium transport system permease protein
VTGAADGKRPNPTRLGFPSEVGRWLRLASKELREILRDRRTILTLVFMPLLLYPLLSVAFRQFVLSRQSTEPPVYRVGIAAGQLPQVTTILNLGAQLHARSDPAAELDPDAPELSAAIRVDEFEDVQDALLQGQIDIGIRVTGEAPRRPSRGDLAFNWEVLVVKRSSVGAQARRWIERAVSAANEYLLASRLHELGVTQRPVPVRATAILIVDPKREREFPLKVVVPLILILMTITGAVYPAIDLTAGERERGTLEILIAAPVPRMSLLFAKYTAVLAVATLTAAINLITMTVTIMASGVGPQLFGPGGLAWRTAAQVLGLLLLFAAFFSALLLTLTSCARSFKEAQAYLIPLMLVSLAPGMISLLPGLELRGLFLVAPLVNIVLLARDVFDQHAAAASAVIVVASTALYAFAAIAIAARVFGSEGVLYNIQIGWLDLFRRPAEPSSRPTLAGATYCLALIFPLYFLLSGLIVHAGTMRSRLVLAGLIAAGVFVGLPVLFAWLSRVRLQETFLLHRPRWNWVAAAILLGVSLWAGAHEIVVLQREWGIVAFSDALLERVRQSLEELRRVGPGLIVAALALAPAVSEEAFFRGYFLSALRGRMRPAAAAAVTSIAFGIFHVVVADALVFVRFIPSTLLGFVLAWLALRSGSIIPAVLLHLTHNCLLVLAAYYQPQLAESGWGASEQEHLPTAWLAAAGALASAGVILALADRLKSIAARALRTAENQPEPS